MTRLFLFFCFSTFWGQYISPPQSVTIYFRTYYTLLGHPSVGHSFGIFVHGKLMETNAKGEKFRKEFPFMTTLVQSCFHFVLHLDMKEELRVFVSNVSVPSSTNPHSFLHPLLTCSVPVRSPSGWAVVVAISARSGQPNTV